MSIVGKCYRFIRYNEHKALTVRAFFLSAYYRFQMLYEDTSKLRKRWGKAGEESSYDETIEDYRYAKKVSYVVHQVCGKTKWESRCLVRALTAQKLLADKGIDSTMYLGCKEDESGKMVAHSWLRCGEYFITGGDGAADGYGVVEKFRVGKENG